MRLALAVAMLGVVTLLPAREPASTPEAERPRVVGYFVEWGIYQRNYPVAAIPADRLTHVNYAFARITPQGEIGIVDTFAAVDKAYPGDKWDPPTTLRGNFNQLIQLKKRHPHLKALIAVGGWTLSSPFSDVASTVESRVKFARSCAAFVEKYGFDGVDLDWEYPVGGGLDGNRVRPEDRANYPLLLSALRQELDALTKKAQRRYLLTIAAPAGPAVIAHFDLRALTPHADWFNLMAYDFHGSWDKQTGFNAPLFADPNDPRADETIRKRFNVHSAVQTYLKAGVPPGKVVLGVPFYGRGWSGVRNENNGLYQPASGPPPKGTWEPGIWDYRDLVANYRSKMTLYRHPNTRVPWLFDAKTGVMISFDDAESIRARADYIRQQKLGGAMVWELSGDDPKAPLVEVLNEALRGAKKP